MKVGRNKIFKGNLLHPIIKKKKNLSMCKNIWILCLVFIQKSSIQTERVIYTVWLIIDQQVYNYCRITEHYVLIYLNHLNVPYDLKYSSGGWWDAQWRMQWCSGKQNVQQKEKRLSFTAATYDFRHTMMMVYDYFNFTQDMSLQWKWLSFQISWEHFCVDNHCIFSFVPLKGSGRLQQTIKYFKGKWKLIIEIALKKYSFPFIWSIFYLRWYP